MTGDGGQDETVAVPELELEQAVAFGVDGFDPEDPWNALLYLEGDATVTVLPLTPTQLDHLVPQLQEVRDSQRAALGLPSDGATSEVVEDRLGAVRRVAHAARVATGSEPVARLWRESLRGKVTLIAAVLVFILAGALLGLLS